jgi:hypothetical protein
MATTDTPVESRPIKGVSLRTLYQLVVATAIICLTVLTTYFELSGMIKEIITTKVKDDKYNDLRMHIMEQKVDANDIQLRELIRSLTPQPNDP